jgi:hypothetical protein
MDGDTGTRQRRRCFGIDWLIAAAIATAYTAGSPAAAEIFISANDGKQLRTGEPARARSADTLTVLELKSGGLRLLGSVTVPASMIGPPQSVASTPDHRLALVTASQKLDASTPAALVPDDTLSVIDLSDRRAPRIVQTSRAGAGASGVAVNARGTLALVANAAADTVSIFAIVRRRLVSAGTVQLEAGSRPVSVVFTPDGRSALVVAQNLDAVLPLAIDATTVRRDGAAIPVGPRPYMIAMARKGDFAFITNLRGRAVSGTETPPATITTIDVRARAVTGWIDVGVTPEHVALSPSGRYLQVTLINGSNAEPGAATYRDHGTVRVFGVGGGALTPLAESRTGRWCQGAAWSSDERRILLQCADLRRIEIFRFDGRLLTLETDNALTFDARPGTLVRLGDR